MSELLNGIFECLDINSGTGLATEDNLQSMTSFQRLFYTQVHEKIGIDAVYFLRDVNGIAKVPLIYFSVIQKYDAKQVAELHRLSWNLGEAPLLFVVTPDEILIYNNYETPQVIENGNLDPTAGIIETLSLTDGLVSQQLALKKYHRSLLESGEYWRESMTRFNAQNRVDATLISNLRIMRRTLINQISKRYYLNKDKTMNFLEQHSIVEKIILTVYVELPQMTHEESSNCKNRCLEKIDKTTIHLECGKECNSDKCNFLCKWFVQKNEYLFLELSALQEYLESLPDNYFLPKIEVIVKSNEKNKLSPKQFTLLKKYVDGR